MTSSMSKSSSVESRTADGKGLVSVTGLFLTREPEAILALMLLAYHDVHDTIKEFFIFY